MAIIEIHPSEPWAIRLKRVLIQHFLLLLATISALSLVHRFEALQYIALRSAFAWHYDTLEGLNIFEQYLRLHWREALVGVRNDILFSILAALALLPPGRVGAIIGIVVLAFFYSANLEHINFNDSHVNLAFIGLALDPTFIKGQTTPLLINKFLKFAAVGLVIFLILQWRPMRILAVIGAPVLALGLFLPVSANLQHPIWIQSHPVAPMIGGFNAEIDDRAFAAGPLVDGNPPLQSFPGKHNVLLVFVEGISQFTLEKAQMTTLQSLAADNIQFGQYFGHQMITANGLYTSHTGFQPYMTDVAMRWYDIAEGSPEAEVALPAILRQAGYQTAFIQSAPLAYMGKGETLPHLGYDIVKGDEDFPDAYSRNAWGVDDLTLVEQTLAQIDEFDPATPWMTSILTTGTHSPYNVPADFEPETPNLRIRAARFADKAVAELMAGLDSRGLLDNTLVIITADEARETAPGSALEGEILRNWLPLIVHHPDGIQATYEDAFSMIDLRNFILLSTGDYDQEAVQTLIDARDVFVFGNMRLDRMFYYNRPDQSFFACNTDDFVCDEFSNATDMRDLNAMTRVGTKQFARLQAHVAALEAASKLCEGDPALCQ